MSGEYFVRKLSAFAGLSDEGKAAILQVAETQQQNCGVREDLVSEGAVPKSVYLILDGWACRYKMLEDGRRQILSVFVPGDLCDLNTYILKHMDHSIGSLTKLRYARITPHQIERLCDEFPRVTRALWWESLVSASIQREWLVNAAQRTTDEALAHLLCELYVRLRLVGLAVNGTPVAFPMTQHDFADAIGSHQSQISRAITRLNDSGVMTLAGRKLTVHDFKKLRDIAGFNPNYLHFA